MTVQHNKKQKTIAVGVLESESVEFSLSGRFSRDGMAEFARKGAVITASCQGDKVAIAGQARDEFLFVATDASICFTLKNVEIGKGFHWQRHQDQSFRGSLRLIAREGRVIAINIIGIEDYLQSVIASEMSPTAGMEFLKAHAVISRSWLLAQLDKKNSLKGKYSSVECDTTDELIRWQDREDHIYYDFCADDHCQRYQGIPQTAGGVQDADVPAVSSSMIRKTAKVIEATWGQVLKYGTRICDARFSKCCGGALEEFKYCWEEKEVPYLKYARDYASGRNYDLRKESAARRWILSNPRAFCNTRSARLLGQVLKDYDSETKDFYRWSVNYSQKELHDIILSRTGDDYGDILDLIPMERGVSGRISRLKIVGSRKSKIIGKELEIRSALSASHLYSSAFVVEKVYDGEKSDDGRVPSGFILRGAGWGHGVGLCQIGAASMGARGYDYRSILAHYYPGADIKTLY